MTIEEIKRRKKELGYTNAYLAELAGLPVSTVNKVLSGATKAPRRMTLAALTVALSCGDTMIRFEDSAGEKDNLHKSSVNYLDDINNEKVNKMQEPALAFQPQLTLLGYRMGPYTLEDYLALPDDDRRELIDGYFYNMSAPTAIHQLIAGQAYRQLCDIVDKNHGNCVPFIAPTDVQVDLSDKTIVQPDVMVICRPKDLVRRLRIFGAPDFVMEVLSPSTRLKDATIKLSKYLESGVREYWLADPDSQKVVVYDLEQDNIIPEVYDFTDTIPIRIWDCKESLDFAKIKKYVDPFMDL